MYELSLGRLFGALVRVLALTLVLAVVAAVDCHYCEIVPDNSKYEYHMNDHGVVR